MDYAFIGSGECAIIYLIFKLPDPPAFFFCVLVLTFELQKSIARKSANHYVKIIIMIATCASRKKSARVNGRKLWSCYA